MPKKTKSKGKKMSAELKSFLKRNGRFPRKGELSRGRASPGAGHKTSHPVGGRHTSSGGGSTPKSAPKPRVAIYGGAIASAGALAGVQGLRPDGFYELPTKRGRTLVSQAAANIGMATTTLSGAIAVGAPVVAGTLISIAADKLGLNKRLARARMPFRL